MLQPSASLELFNGTMWSTMSLQKESELHDYLSSQSSIVGDQHSVAMHCANPQCSKELLYLREGTLRLLELEPHSDGQFRPDDGAFAMRSLPSKYFWLCGECTKTHIVKRWTTSGVVLVSRSLKTSGSHPSLVDRPATAATSPPLPVSLTVPPMGRTPSGRLESFAVHAAGAS
jgi:hypothetical protein